ncbi:hypothetical protein ACQR1V_13635 [Bradyrhizobium oligotrophicum]|uniref:hypothetical protein n=1 Tax=Bradyrhizobium oligotrophicum TaxID=44255 RepID=UPI003EC01549
MSKRRKRTSPTSSLRERLLQFAAQAQAAATTMPAGTARSDLLKKASASATAAEIDRWLSPADGNSVQRPARPSTFSPIPRRADRQGLDRSSAEQGPLRDQAS